MTDHTGKKNMIAVSRSLLITLLFGALALGIFIGAGMGIFTPLQAAKSESAPVGREGEFRFIRTSFEAKDPKRKAVSRELKPFQYKVSGLIESRLKTGEVSAVSIYFRDLNNGNWFGIGEHDKFSPKSLLKLPLMIAYFKWSESAPLVLRKKIAYTGKETPPERTYVKPHQEIEPGKTYTVNDLIYRMIVHDDAAAYALLYANLPEGRLDRIFKDLYVEYDPHKTEDSLSLSAFAAFYRVLFNASYLNEEMSEKALRYLSKSTFRQGMAAGVPPNIDIASKHGERMTAAVGDSEEQLVYQFHEFGIIYHPNRPFLLGIMARGDDVDQLEKILRDITRLVYEEVDLQS